MAKVTGATAFTLKESNPAKPVCAFHALWVQARSRVHVSPPAALVGFQLGGSTGRYRARSEFCKIRSRPDEHERGRRGAPVPKLCVDRRVDAERLKVWHSRSAPYSNLA